MKCPTLVHFRVQECNLSVSNISAVNLIVGLKLFAFPSNSSIFSVLVSHKENTSSMYLFHTNGFLLLDLSKYVSLFWQ